MRCRHASVIARIVLAPIIVWTIYILRANIWFRLYPAMMTAMALSFFVASLFKTPLIEVFARRMGECLDDAGVAYCRRVTWAWVVFLALNLGLSLITTLLSYKVWAFYNGFLSYILMGVMFIGEWIIRRRVRRG